MSRKIILSAILVFLFAISCEKETKRMDDFWVEFATVIKSESKTVFRLDNFKTLVPKELKDYSGKDGQRVVLNFTPLHGDTVKINSISNVITGTIQETHTQDNIVQNPLKIQSVWVGGNYLNMILEIEFYEKNHNFALYRNTASNGIQLYFSHNTNQDPRGYAKKIYLSFSLSSIQSAQNSPTPFQLFINTHTGLRVFDMEVK